METPSAQSPNSQGPPSPNRSGLRAAWSTLSRVWKIVVAAIVAVLAIVIVSLAATSGTRSTTLTKVVVTPPSTVTVSRTVTQTRTVKAPASAPAPTPTPAPATASGKTFSGNGSRNLGTITVGQDSTLRWTNDGGIFQMWDDNFEIFVNSQGSSGETFMAAGSYSGVVVNAVGNWTIEIVPGG